MAHIVGLTIIMQTLYWLTITDHRPITSRHIMLAYTVYKKSPEKGRVHTDIKEYVKKAGIFERDGVVAKIVELIDCNRIESAEMHNLMDKMGNVDFSANDEPWGELGRV